MLQEASQGYKSSESVHGDGHRGGTTGRQTSRGQRTERTWGCTLLPVPWTSRRADAFLARGEGVIRRWGSVGEFFHL